MRGAGPAQEDAVMRLVSRESKGRLDHEAFVDRRAALGALRDELGALAGAVGRTARTGDFDEERGRTITVLDTPGTDPRREGVVLRRGVVRRHAGSLEALRVARPAVVAS
jgi:hypothetical protein